MRSPFLNGYRRPRALTPEVGSSRAATCAHPQIMQRARYARLGWSGMGDCRACGGTVMAPDAPTAQVSIR